jgi:hypothetical protein
LSLEVLGDLLLGASLGVFDNVVESHFSRSSGYGGFDATTSGHAVTIESSKIDHVASHLCEWWQLGLDAWCSRRVLGSLYPAGATLLGCLTSDTAVDL